MGFPFNTSLYLECAVREYTSMCEKVNLGFFLNLLLAFYVYFFGIRYYLELWYNNNMKTKKGESRRTFNVKWSPRFAYAIGLLTTDGNLSSDQRHMSLISKDREQVLN